jgi:chromosome segregation ATPase
LRTADANRLRKQNQVYQSEIRKYISQNSELSDEVRRLSGQVELDSRAATDFRSKSLADIERLEDELKSTKQALNDELIAKKSLLSESKKAKKEANLASDKAEREEKKVVALNDTVRSVTKEKEDLEGQWRDVTIKFEGAERENIDLKVTVDVLNNLLEKKKKEIDVMKAKYDALEIDHEHMMAEIEQERNEREASEEQAAKLSIQIEKLKRALVQVKKQKEESDTVISTFKSDMAELRFQIEAEKQNTLKEEREKRQAIEKMKDALGSTDKHTEDITSVQRQVKKREREAQKHLERVEEQAKQINTLERQVEEFKTSSKKFSEGKEDAEYKLQLMSAEKQELVKQLRELEVYKKFV